MNTTPVLKTLGANAVLALILVGPTIARGQSTTYGEDPVPASHEGFERWRPYGSDPVPPSRFADHAYVQAYGMDPVPGQPLNDFTPVRIPPILPDSVVPEQTIEVLTDGR